MFLNVFKLVLQYGPSENPSFVYKMKKHETYGDHHFIQKHCKAIVASERASMLTMLVQVVYSTVGCVGRHWMSSIGDDGTYS